MPRRSHHNTPKGKLYAIEWPEWHVDCSDPNCDLSLQIADLGRCVTLKEAKKAGQKLIDTGRANGWVCCKGRWFCTLHKGSQ